MLKTAICASCVISIVFASFMGCGGKKASETDLSMVSRNIITDFSGELKDELYAAIQDSGLVYAVSICAERGPEIAARYSSMPGWTVRRVSSKYRNPADKPDDFEQEVLSMLESRPAAAGDEYFRWTNENGKESFRYMQAIRVKATCLNCHGDREKFSDELKQVLDEKYPDDHAYGFSIDDYRGAFSVKIDWPEGRAAFDSLMAGT